MLNNTVKGNKMNKRLKTIEEENDNLKVKVMLTNNLSFFNKN